MNLPFPLLLLFSLPTLGQNATFQEIRLFASAEYYNPKEKTATIVFPIVITKDQTIGKKINDRIKKEMFDLEYNQSPKSDLKTEINAGLTDVSYKVTYNKNNILSLNIYTEESGGHQLSHETNYFNFDLTTGYEIGLSDLLPGDKIDSFKRKVLKDRTDSLNKFLQDESVLLKKKIIDSLDFQWIVEEINREKDTTLSEGIGETFTLSNQGLEIIMPCEFSGAYAYMSPTFRLKYSFSSLKQFINPEYLNRLQK